MNGIEDSAPVGPVAAAGLIAFAVVYGVLALGTASYLVYRSDHHLMRIRSPKILFWCITYNAYIVGITCASYIVGKTPSMCMWLSYSYTLLLPLFPFPYLLMFPTIVFANELNNLKRARVQEGKTDHWRWRVRNLFSTKSKMVIIFIAALCAIVIYVAVTYSGVPMPGGENGQQAPGQEADCYRRALLLSSAAGLFYRAVIAFFVMKAMYVEDPYFVRAELMMVNNLLAPFIMCIEIYGFGPQVFPAGFDLRWLGIALCSVAFIASPLPLTLLTFKPVEDMADRYQTKLINWWKGVKEETRPNSQELQDINAQLAQPVDVFAAVLDNSILLEAFIVYTVKDWSVENILFWTEVRTFKEYYTNRADEERTEKAKTICKEFVQMSAPLAINIDYSLRASLVKQIRENRINEHVFDQAQVAIYELMKKDSFEKWQRSPEYRNAVKEAVKTKIKDVSDSKTSLQSLKKDMLQKSQFGSEFLPGISGNFDEAFSRSETEKTETEHSQKED